MELDYFERRLKISFLEISRVKGERGQSILVCSPIQQQFVGPAGTIQQIHLFAHDWNPIKKSCGDLLGKTMVRNGNQCERFCIKLNFYLPFPQLIQGQ